MLSDGKHFFIFLLFVLLFHETKEVYLLFDIPKRSSLRSKLFNTDTKVSHLEISTRTDQSISLSLNFILTHRCLFSVVESKDSPLPIYANRHMEIWNIRLIFAFAFLLILIECLSTFFLT